MDKARANPKVAQGLSIGGAAYRKLRVVKLGTPLLVLACLAMITLPIPPVLLDMLFSFNIALSMVVLLVAIYAKKPLDFGSFPTVLLLTTILRLALNVASTRVILLHGQDGTAAAGKVIEAFGHVVMGGSYTVGLIVFTILMIINFIVVTKGAGRISEVSARFTLDAMPGKQMAIDADLNAGLINQEQARERRSEIAREADFYGSMDGASKFVKGDAIAGMLILFINIIGGIIIGTIFHGMSMGEAARVYVLLTIGDGLVAQIPSLLLSVAAAIIVTRQNGTDNEMGQQVVSELFNEPKTMYIVAGVLFVMGIVPGMPHMAFLSLAAISLIIGLLIKSKKAAEAEAAMAPPPEPPEQAPDQRELSWDDVSEVDVIGLEVGYRLIPMVDKAQGGELLNRVKGVRKKLSQDLGFLIPPVHIRDNLDLGPNSYRITLMGVTFGEAEIQPDRDMAINPGQVFGRVPGIPTKDPAFGLEAVWISKPDNDRALGLGYTVVDCSTVVATHLSQILANNCASLIGQEEVQNILDIVSKTQPKLVNGLVPNIVNLGLLTKLLQNLLHEGVPVRDMRTILETLVEYAPKSQDPEVLTAACRIGLRRLIIQDIVGGDLIIPVITLSPDLEKVLHKSLETGGAEGVGIEPGLADRMQKSLYEATANQEMAGEPAILLTSGILRSTLSRFVKNTIPGLRVLSYQEIPDDKQIKIVSVVGNNNAQPQIRG
ncbi:flagellar biosynthesis protein FlhA [Anaerobiospirillum sp. NML120449]|uniref:flagellar biosynthesis protein FlhA n=1 Tax=Anaerobiospirillum sp. NML120449 TaxID=2932817 RepID=UPI001FF11B20|nr:flagellar biosynthesis protein FlhA [Anaerobiospirillum sp. NML120449]MCK0526369.1 flagellar biosynthesis protein FlhA [Anaerobiospirillum sp. NML120449]